VFTPATLTINAGETATFVFAALGHNVTFDTQSAGTPADIPGVNSNKSVQRPFTTAGTYAYHCTIHPGMHGSVVVR
jgi:plastocyanin